MIPEDDWLSSLARQRDEAALAELRKERELWLANPPQPYLLTFTGPEQERPHSFCGENNVEGAECPNCRKPLIMVASFETARLPFLLAHSAPRQLHLLYCWTCAIPYDLFSYRIGARGTVEVVYYLNHHDGAFGPDGPYDGYTGIFPQSKIGLRPLSVDEQQLAVQLRAQTLSSPSDEEYRHLTEPVHQVGGFPRIYNAQDQVPCPDCKAPSPFFAAICDNAVGQEYQSDENRTFTANCGVQMIFNYCGKCSIMTAYHSCD